MKKTLLLLSLLANVCHATQLFNYQETLEAVRNGRKITYVVDWDRCTLSIPGVIPNSESSYTPDHVIIDKNGLMRSRGMIYAHEIMLAPEAGSANQSFVYTLTKENELQVINRFLDPVTYTEKIPAVQAVCRLNDAVKVFVD